MRWGAVEILGGRYVVEETAGERCFHGIDAKVGTPIEIELMASVDEVRFASRVDHPNVPLPLDVGQLVDGTPYVVRRRYAGETLRARLARVGTLPLEEVVRLGIDLLSVIARAHES